MLRAPAKGCATNARRRTLAPMSAQIAGAGHADSNLSPDLAKIARSALRQAASTVRDPSVVFAFVAAGNPRATGHDDLLAVAQEEQLAA